MKKSIFYISAICIALATLCFIHYNWKPEEMPVVTRSNTTGHLEYNQVNEFVYQQEGYVHLFFFSSNEADSQLVIKNILQTIQEENKISSIKDLYYVDLANLPSDVSEKYTKNNWGFYNCPTFVRMKIENNKVELSDILEWDSTNPYTIENVRTWLQDHKLITQN